MNRLIGAALALVMVGGMSHQATAAPPASTNAPALPGRAEERGLRLGTNEVVGGRWMSFRAPLSAYAQNQVPSLNLKQPVPWVSAALVLPENWKGRPLVPILVVCSPSGAPAIPGMAWYTNAARAEGWAVLAAEGPRLPQDRDTVMWNWGAVESALNYLHQSLPMSRTWPLAIGGFSGGAKRAACVAAAALQFNHDVRGVFMGGCNEDRATTGRQLYAAGPRFLTTKMFLSNGTEDPIANPGHGEAVRASMQQTGFREIRFETYAGGHRLEEEHVRHALKWFGESGMRPK